MREGIVTFDVETTGLHPLFEHIVEIAAVRWVNGEPVATFQTLVDPGQPIDPAATAIHGICDADVRRQPKVGGALDAFWQFVGPHPLAAHNAVFDAGFLVMESLRTRRRLPTKPLLDTLALARAAYPHLSSHRLDLLASRLRIQSGRAHRALADAMTAGHLLHRAMKRLSQAPARVWLPWGLLSERDLSLPLSWLARAAQHGAWVTITYAKEGIPQLEERRVKPLGVFTVNRRCYLYAYCSKRQADRTFQVDRIRAVSPGAEAAVLARQ